MAMKEEIEEILASNGEFLAGGRCLEAAIDLKGPSVVERFIVDHGVLRNEHDNPRAVRITMTVTPEGWAMLEDSDAVNITLNRLFRLGHVDFGDGLHDVMHHWSAFFWLTAALRQALSGTSEV